ncbi:MAG TPA: acetyl-CoA C-acetyltransferase [Elusimicrobiales bacterium]|nr:acetyl-CoA C-acetyltransferase [Elusimicrobiales bacterium]
MSNEIFLIDGLRTPIGSFGGSLAPFSAAALGKTVLEALLKKNKLTAETVDEVILGCVLQAGQGQNTARQAALGAGLPKEKTAMTVNMVCGSGMRAIACAAQAIKSGDAELIAAGGTESMNNAPYLLKNARTGYRMGHGELTDSMVADGLWDIFNNYHMGVTAENLAAKYNISRQDQDAFAASSQQKAGKALAEGKFKDETVPVLIPQKKGNPVTFDKDEYPRPATTAETLAKLKPAFKKDGSVTAGNSSGVNDGAACLLVGSEAAVKKHSLKPMARLVSYAWAGVDPSVMGIGPVEAVRKALAKAGWKLQDLELIEANEAFAVQSLSVGKELGWNADIVNVNGGAIALGHPIGASGARIMVTLLHEMRRRKAKKGLATLCIGGGMGIASCDETL